MLTIGHFAWGYKDLTFFTRSKGDDVRVTWQDLSLTCIAPLGQEYSPFVTWIEGTEWNYGNCQLSVYLVQVI